MKSSLKYLAFFLFTLCISACSSLPPSAITGQEHGQIAGTNPKKIIFIHGMFVTPKSWDHWTEYFRKAGYQVSAPAWPLHDLPIDQQRTPESEKQLAKLTFEEVLESYRKILKAEPVKPILIGHSLGGLIAQILLEEGLAQAAIAIDSAPPKGTFVLNWSFLSANWGVIRPFADLDRPIELDEDDFSYAFTNRQPSDVQKKAYAEYYVPESRRVGKGPTTDTADISESKSRAPLLIIAGGEDHIIPPNLNYKNFRKYEDTPAYTEFVLFPGRDHWTIAADGWENVAAKAQQWIEARFR